MLEDHISVIIKELEGYYLENIDIADEPQVQHLRKAIKHLRLSNASTIKEKTKD